MNHHAASVVGIRGSDDARLARRACVAGLDPMCQKRQCGNRLPDVHPWQALARIILKASIAARESKADARHRRLPVCR